MDETFVCRRCGRTLPVELMTKSLSRPLPSCKECIAAYVRECRRRNPERRAKERAADAARYRALIRLKNRHPAEFFEIVEEEKARLDVEVPA